MPHLLVSFARVFAVDQQRHGHGHGHGHGQHTSITNNGPLDWSRHHSTSRLLMDVQEAIIRVIIADGGGGGTAKGDEADDFSIVTLALMFSFSFRNSSHLPLSILLLLSLYERFGTAWL